MRNRRNCLRMLLLAPWPSSLMAEAGSPSVWRRQPEKPQLSLLQLDGTPWRLSAQRGQAVLINFWASWCGPCRAEMPALEKLWGAYRAQGLQVVAVNYREPTANIERYLSSTSTQLPVLRDPEGAVAQRLDVHIFPTTIAIDRQGQVRWAVVGEYDWDSAEAARYIFELLLIGQK